MLIQKSIWFCVTECDGRVGYLICFSNEVDFHRIGDAFVTRQDLQNIELILTPCACFRIDLVLPTSVTECVGFFTRVTLTHCFLAPCFKPKQKFQFHWLCRGIFNSLPEIEQKYTRMNNEIIDRKTFRLLSTTLWW